MRGRESVKFLARSVATLAVLPALLSYCTRKCFLGPDRALEGSSQALALIPGIPGQYLRRAFLSRVLARCHPSSTVEFGTIFSKRDARIDENVYIGPGCHIGLVHIERDSLLGPGVQIPSGRLTHGISDTSRPISQQPGLRTLVRIGAGSWIGGAAVIMADVGNKSVVGAGAVVTRALPDGVVACGVPARVLRQRDT